MVSDGLELPQSTDAEGEVGTHLTQKPSEGGCRCEVGSAMV